MTGPAWALWEGHEMAKDVFRQVLVTLVAAWVIGQSPQLQGWINRQWTGY